LKIAAALFVAMDPDAGDEIKVPALSRGILDRQVLDHAPDLTPVVQSELDAQPLILQAPVPSGFVVAGFLDLIGPILETAEIEVLMFRGQIYDLHSLLLVNSVTHI
jgi:hypothetical protein